jgi:TolA-binding protein
MTQISKESQVMKKTAVVVVMLVVGGCSKPSAEESFLAGEQAQKEAEAGLGSSQHIQDSLFQRAIGFYEAVVEDHPEDERAEMALFRIAELHNNGTRRFMDAINAYERSRSAYPSSPMAPVSLFMIGFLYNNEIRQFDKAAACYREFLDRYPDHELAGSARAELENIGKSPEQIIEKQLAATKESDRKQ